jgi:hypothetical protein
MRSILLSFSRTTRSTVWFVVRLLRRLGRRRRFGRRLPAALLRLAALQILPQGRGEPLAPPPIPVSRACPNHAAPPANRR